MTEDQEVPPGIDPATPSPARLYDYYLGGTDNFRVPGRHGQLPGGRGCGGADPDRDAVERIRTGMRWSGSGPGCGGADPGPDAGTGRRRMGQRGFHQRTALWMAGPAAVTYVGEWGAEDPELADGDGSRWSYGGVARRP
jgi:S-adenosyl methyltransferase